VTPLLDLVALKPIAIFVWWFSTRANRLVFERRRELRTRVDRALASGRPVLLASNHVAWFDDPVIPMALYRTGERALAEVAGLAVWVALCWLDPLGLERPLLQVALALLGAWGVGRFGAKKVWWTLGDYLNLQDASVLRGKVGIVRGGRPPGLWLRWLLALADPTIRGFMRSRTVRTLFVDRRPGEEAKRARARTLSRAVGIAARPEPFWIFFEGGRTKVPGTIAPARRGVGALALALRERGLDPLLIAVSHRGMERLIPPGGARFLGFGHRVDVAWAEVPLPPEGSDPEKEAQVLADAVREEVVRLQAGGAAQ
jgi:1-acyl-sn-glycerol-3-phosphate acyltransferase